jgi:hypothetical protein
MTRKDDCGTSTAPKISQGGPATFAKWTWPTDELRRQANRAFEAMMPMKKTNRCHRGSAPGLVWTRARNAAKSRREVKPGLCKNCVRWA